MSSAPHQSLRLQNRDSPGLQCSLGQFAFGMFETAYIVTENLILPVGRGHLLLLAVILGVHGTLAFGVWGIAKLIERSVHRLSGLSLVAPPLFLLTVLAVSHYRMRVNLYPRSVEGTLITLAIGVVMLGVLVLALMAFRAMGRRSSVVVAVAGVLFAVVVVVFFGARWRALEQEPEMGTSREERVLGAGGIEATGKKVLLVGLDGGDWKVMDRLLQEGRLPNLAGLIARGSTAALETIKPTYSPVIWTTIAAGTRPEQHRVLDHSRSPLPFGLPDSPVQIRSLATLTKPLSLMARRRARTDQPRWAVSGHVQSARIWEILDSLGVPTVVMDWYVSHPASGSRGVMVSDRLHLTKRLGSIPGSVSPSERQTEFEELALDRDELPESMLDSFFDLKGLDEASRGRFLEDFSRIVSPLASELARNETTRRLLAPAFESAPDWRLGAVYFRAMDLSHHLGWSYLDAKAEDGGDDDSWRLAPLVDRSYDYSDKLLGDVLGQIDDNTVVMVLSDHGWEDDLREHHEAPDGFFVIAGPEVKKSRDRGRISVYEIAPLAMALLGLPVADDFTATVPTHFIEGSFWERYPVRRLASYQLPRSESVIDDAEMDAETIKYLKSLGYL